ncbi:MAG TPA: hypothetical protein VNI84_13580 [Pyrinomonadaceae bacterium]|nr:hypothetical protein [Pyrinomonadaceae bacterium]
MTKTVVGLFDEIEAAREVVRELIDAGIAADEISFVANNVNNEPMSYEGGDDMTGTATGIGVGAVVGGVGGLLVGIGAFAVPGIGPVVGAGWLATMLTGAGIGALTGGLLGALTDVGIPEEDAQYYTEGVRRGGTLIAVKTREEDAARVVGIMRSRGAVDINKRGANYRANGYTGYNPTAQPLTAAEIERERLNCRSYKDDEIVMPPFSGHRL